MKVWAGFVQAEIGLRWDAGREFRSECEAKSRKACSGRK